MSSPAAIGSPALPPLPLPGAKPREIHAALHPEYREEFDRDYREALAEAGRTLDLEGVFDTLEYWRMRSWITRDSREHRRVVRRAVELLTGQEPPMDEPVTVIEARL
ncbi:MAG: DUF6247 family protein [Pseudonocardiaceae bacterium]